MSKATFLVFPHLPVKCSYLNTKYSMVPRNFGPMVTASYQVNLWKRKLPRSGP